MEESQHYVCGSVAYDGTDFHGFQYQVGVPTVQRTLEDALDCFVARVGRVVGSGRTDAGVHANGQIVAVAVVWRHSLDSLQRAWNAHLPSSIAVRRVRVAPEGFHPRHSAVSRTYRYVVWQCAREDGWATPSRSPLTDRFAYFEPQLLNLGAMKRAAELLVGRHDFATFGKPPQGMNTQRTVYAAEWTATERLSTDRYPGQMLEFTITADAFLQRMVRSIVACLLAVGRGRWDVDDFRGALAAAARSQSLAPAPPQGLVLDEVTYPDDLNALVHGRLDESKEKLA